MLLGEKVVVVVVIYNFHFISCLLALRQRQNKNASNPRGHINYSNRTDTI